jgi:predicted ABC-type ATPase
MKTFQELIEGVYDPNIFKAFFMAGGPGSGKSYAAGKTTAGHGLKVVNSDQVFEKYLKDAKLSFEMPDEQAAKRDERRTSAKRVTAIRKANYIEGRLGMVIDGTGKDFGKITTQASSLKSIGYEVYMLFVNTSLEVALERNKERGRKGEREVPEKIVIDAWKQVQNNIGKFQSFFGSKNFIIVDNNKIGDKVFDDVAKRIRGLLSKKVDNWIAKAWIANQLRLHKKT